MDGNNLIIDVTCSKGTYIRTLAEDLAQSLGTCAHLSLLRRTYTSPFDGFKMIELDQFEAMSEEDRWHHVIATDSVLLHMGEYISSQEDADFFLHGRPVSPENPPPVGEVRIYNSNKDFIGLGVMESNGLLRPKRIDPAFQK